MQHTEGELSTMTATMNQTLHDAAAGGALATSSTWAEIEAGIDQNRQDWARAHSRASFARCYDRRRELLERAAGLPIESNADAATALRVAMKAPGNDDESLKHSTENLISVMGKPEDQYAASIRRNVAAYLSKGRA